MEKLKRLIKNKFPVSVFTFLKFVRNNDIWAFIRFLNNRSLRFSFSEKVKILKRIYSINNHVVSQHTQTEILSLITGVLELPDTVPGKIVEAGCFKGGSTAKLSIAVEKKGRELFVFDSFAGIPENDELHDKNIFGGKASFKKGDYMGGLEEVKSNVEKYGQPSCCKFFKGWFDDTLPKFNEAVAVMFVDVDLASSTKTCLKYLYPLLSSGGILYSHDGHLPLVLQVYNDDKFWEEEVGCKKPKIEGFNKSKLIKITKP